MEIKSRKSTKIDKYSSNLLENKREKSQWIGEEEGEEEKEKGSTTSVKFMNSFNISFYFFCIYIVTYRYVKCVPPISGQGVVYTNPHSMADSMASGGEQQRMGEE